MTVLLYYYLLINIVLFFTMLWDKASAMKQRWRVPESRLLLMALLGGGFGGLIAMAVCRHKIRKPKFWLVFGGSVLLHMAGWLLLFSNVLK